MSEFKFNVESANATSFEAKVSNYLKPWGIYPVKIKDFKFDVMQGKKDPNATFDGLRISFESDSGEIFDQFIFGVNSADDMVRKVYNDRQMPSQFETLRLTINHIIGAFDTEAVKKLENAIAGKSATTKQYINTAAKVMAPNLGKECFIKLIGDNNNYASMPRIVAVFENDAEAVISNNFISRDESKLTFSNYELRKKEELANRKPTNMSTSAGFDPIGTSSGSEDSLDFSSLSSDDELPF